LPDTLLKSFHDCNAILEGHFQLSSGLHSDRYFQCALLFDDPRLGRRLTEALANKVEAAVASGEITASARRTSVGRADRAIDRVVGPALGGVIVAHELGAALGVRACFTERQGERMTLRRGFTIEPGERVLICEDVITTGGSAQEVAVVVGEHGGEVVALASLVDRSGGKAPFEPFIPLLAVDVKSWPAEQCPLCASGVPLTKPGSRPAAPSPRG
jgi:orotate phosphoribosyltransferase